MKRKKKKPSTIIGEELRQGDRRPYKLDHKTGPHDMRRERRNKTRQQQERNYLKEYDL